MHFKRSVVGKAIAILLVEPSGDVIKDLTTIAVNLMIGVYDKRIRLPLKYQGETTKAFIQAIRVVRSALRDIEAVGCQYYGQDDDPIVTNYLIPRIHLKEMPTTVWVAEVIEYSDRGARKDGHLLLRDKADYKSMLKSAEGNHLQGDASCFSTISSEFVERKLTTTGSVILFENYIRGINNLWYKEKIEEIIYE
jgi:hypothetical protein